MHLDPALCYEAMKSRDRRFDGRFFTGVATTGIYCRPICPAPTPRSRNVRFFPSAAAAEAAGHRPCRRCRPETSPGTPAWLGSSATTSRALRLISDGALDEAGVDDLAARLGIGGRQLRRLFVDHLGASPLAIARARRVHFARSLLDDTDLPIADVAFSSGFGSIRQFNDAMRSTFGRTPTELRKKGRRGRVSASDGEGLTIRLPYRPPLDADSVLSFLAGRAIPGVEVVTTTSYLRTIEVDGAPATLELRPEPAADRLVMSLRAPSHDNLIEVVERARRIFDLGADPIAIEDHLRGDPIIGPKIAARPGLRVPGAWDPFEVAVRAILGQQISVGAATKLAGRLVLAFGKPVEGLDPAGPTHLFPTPESLAGADLATIGMTRGQARAIGSLALEMAEGRLTLDASLGLDDAIERLCTIVGIGPWTAHYTAMRAFGEPDAFPAGDLGLRKAAGTAGTPVSAVELETLARSWRPWRAYAAMHLWTSLA